MKKRILSLALVGAMALTPLSLVGCNKSESGDASKGSVYFLNFKPEQKDQWAEIAKTYTEKTGVEVKVETSASGQYETDLQAKIAKEDAPTLFQVNGPIGILNWGEYCYDLSDTEVYKNLINDKYALKVDDEVLGIAYCIESYGLIVNKTLLSKAGYTVDDIKSFADLKKVAEDITARKSELGFSAFTSAGLDASSDWRFKTHLANIPIYLEYQAEGISTTKEIKGTYLPQYKALFDLYINNSTCEGKDLSAKTGDDSESEFIQSKAVFFQNGSWEYAKLSETFKDDELAMIPIYAGSGDEAKQSICTGTENYWSINKDADQADIDATIDFVNWLTTSDEGTKAMGEDLGFQIPFSKAVEATNLFVKQEQAYIAEGRTAVTWDFATIPSENWKNNVGSALKAYAADQSDANWKAVEKAFVEGWKSEYELLGQ